MLDCIFIGIPFLMLTTNSTILSLHQISNDQLGKRFMGVCTKDFVAKAIPRLESC